MDAICLRKETKLFIVASFAVRSVLDFSVDIRIFSFKRMLSKMMSYWHQPDIDPVLIHLYGPLQIRWYSLLYVGAFILGGWIMRRLAREDRFQYTPQDADQFVLWLLVSAVVGSRVIYCFVYDFKTLLYNPLFLFQIYRGGLSFHGGLLGTIVAAIVFSRKKGIPFWNLADAMSLVAPIGLGMGRLGNFINGELWGRVSYVPWAMIFKSGGPEPRHPSQLYELALEGIVLTGVLWVAKKYLKKDGQLTFLFLVGYATLRFFVEFFREPDSHIGYLSLGLTMGQWLCIVMFFASWLAYLFLIKPANES